MSDFSLAAIPYKIALALSLASSSTGADYDYLAKTAHRESSFQADAKAPTSSAQGLFQFIDETWIQAIKDDGPRFGLSQYADKIEKSGSGKYRVADPKDREAILALRADPAISATMAGAYAQRNADLLEADIGRRPTSGELYIAHFLGPGDASRLIRMKDLNTGATAADLFPRAAAANRALFYDNGRALSPRELYDRLIASKRQHRKLLPASAYASVELGSWNADVDDGSGLASNGGGLADDESAVASISSPEILEDGWAAEVGDAAPETAAVPAPRIAAARVNPAKADQLFRGSIGENGELPERLTVEFAGNASADQIKVIHVKPAVLAAGM